MVSLSAGTFQFSVLTLTQAPNLPVAVHVHGRGKRGQSRRQFDFANEDAAITRHREGASQFGTNAELPGRQREIVNWRRKTHGFRSLSFAISTPFVSAPPNQRNIMLLLSVRSVGKQIYIYFLKRLLRSALLNVSICSNRCPPFGWLPTYI